MSIKTLSFAFIAIFLMSGCASTQQTDGQTTPQDADAAKDAEILQEANATQTTEVDLDEVTCRRIAKVGTRLTTKVCATNREWQEVAKRAQQTTEKFQREAAANRPSDGG